ncbi:hypothetical protein ACIQUQ_06220 [Streptomyces sp. NPDC101118]|uniref:hypothetical protein n=1 Tax=Streptomyces sp. NPDC101118 TaxID=3366109 RepID=UPI003819E658
MRPSRALTAAAAAVAVLLPGVTGCAPEGGAEARTPSAPATASPQATASPTASSASSASSAPAAPAASTPAPHTPAARPSAGTPAPSKSPSRPPVPTYLSMSLSAPGGQLSLKPGGPGQEFTVTLRNGNTRSYRSLLLAFQLEIMPGGTGGWVLERWDRAAGSWRHADLRIANDVMPPSMYAGGSSLARDAVSVRRYRLRAETGAAPGPNPLMVSLIDTAHDTRHSYAYVPQTTLAP